ncbi:hypothetical protein ES703_18078 [subsurface metagenome]
MKTALTRRLPRETMILRGEVEPGRNGHKFWQGKVNVLESIKRCLRRERQGKEAHLWNGLEILWVTHHLKSVAKPDHSPGLPFLKKIEVPRYTLSRRVKLVKQFMRWAGIADIPKYKTPELIQVLEAMELLDSKCCNLQHFFDYLEDQVPLEHYMTKRQLESIPLPRTWGVNLWPHLRVIDHVLQSQFINWTAEEQETGLNELCNWGHQLAKFVEEARALRRGVTMGDMLLEVTDES